MNQKKASWQTKLSPRKDVWMQACNIQSIRQKDSIWGIHCGFCSIVLFRLKTVFKSLKRKRSIHYKIDSQSMYTILEMINYVIQMITYLLQFSDPIPVQSGTD